MDKWIEHAGVVVSVSGTTVRVRIVQASACAACEAKQMCMSADSQEKEMDVTALEPLEVGDEVVVRVQERLGWKAVVLAYIVPFIVLIVSIVVLSMWVAEWIAGLIGIAAIGVYYGILRLFRGRLQRQFSFTAQKRG